MICIHATVYDEDVVRGEGRGAYPRKTVRIAEDTLKIGVDPWGSSQLFRPPVPSVPLGLVSQEEIGRDIQPKV